RAPQLPSPPQSARDRYALGQANLFPRWSAAAGAGEERHQLTRALLDLRRLSPDETAVVYLSAAAVRDERGAVVILPADADPDQPSGGLPLREVLAALRDCPARHRLLILDVCRPLADPRLGVLADDAAAGVEAEVRSAD